MKNETIEITDNFFNRLKGLYKHKFGQLQPLFSKKNCNDLLSDSFMDINWKILKTKGNIMDIIRRNGMDEFANFEELINFIYKNQFKRILMKGRSGIGKTVFALRTLNLWADERILKDFNLVIFVDIKKLKFGETIYQAFIRQIFGKTCSEANQYAEIVERIVNYSNLNILFIFDQIDGIDEILNEDIKEMIDIYSKHPLILWCDEQFSKFVENTYDCVIELLGFDHHQLTTFFERYLYTDPTELIQHLLDSDTFNESGMNYVDDELRSVENQLRLNKLTDDELLQETVGIIRKLCTERIDSKLLHDNSSFFDACKIPSIATFYANCWRKYRNTLPNSELEFFRLLTDKSIEAYLKKTTESAEKINILFKSIIGELALLNISESVIIITEELTDQIKKISKYASGLFRTIKYQNALEDDYCIKIRFLHLSIQEYFSAQYLIHLYETENNLFENFLHEITNLKELSKYLKIIQFIGGINFKCFQTFISYFNELLHNECKNSMEDWKEKFQIDNSTAFEYSLKCLLGFWKKVLFTLFKYLDKKNYKLIFHDKILNSHLEIKKYSDLDLFFPDEEIVSNNFSSVEVHNIFLNDVLWKSIAQCENLEDLSIFHSRIEDSSLRDLGEFAISKIKSLNFQMIDIDWESLIYKLGKIIVQ